MREEKTYLGKVRFTRGDRCQALFTPHRETEEYLLIKRGGLGSFDRQAFDLLGGNPDKSTPPRDVVFWGIREDKDEFIIRIIRLLPDVTKTLRDSIS